MRCLRRADDAMGEELAMVVRVADASLSEDALRTALKARIAAYKVPKYIELTQEPLARGATEKFDKRTIQAAFMKPIYRRSGVLFLRYSAVFASATVVGQGSACIWLEPKALCFNEG